MVLNILDNLLNNRKKISKSNRFYWLGNNPSLTRSPDKDLLESGKVILVEGDGRLGLKEYAPYDAIHVGAGSFFIVFWEISS